MTMVTPGPRGQPRQFIPRLKFAQLTDYFAQITSKRIPNKLYICEYQARNEHFPKNIFIQLNNRKIFAMLIIWKIKVISKLICTKKIIGYIYLNIWPWMEEN